MQTSDRTPTPTPTPKTKATYYLPSELIIWITQRVAHARIAGKNQASANHSAVVEQALRELRAREGGNTA